MAITPEQLVEHCKKDDETKFDFRSKGPTLRFKFDDHWKTICIGPIELPNKDITWANTQTLEHVDGQICDRLDIPLQYYNRCPPILKLSNLNYWIEHRKPKGYYQTPSYLLRIRLPKSNIKDEPSNLRAFLSSQYYPLNNTQIAEAIVKAKIPNIWNYSINETSFYASTWQNICVLDAVDFITRLCVYNSETGHHSLGTYYEITWNKTRAVITPELLRQHQFDALRNIPRLGSRYVHKTYNSSSITSLMSDLQDEEVHELVSNTLLTTFEQLRGRSLTESEFEQVEKLFGKTIVHNLHIRVDMPRQEVIEKLSTAAPKGDDILKEREFFSRIGSIMYYN